MRTTYMAKPGQVDRKWYVVDAKGISLGRLASTIFSGSLAKTEGQYDVLVNVNGGGFSGQAGATRHGIARALLTVDPDFRDALKKAGLLTRDPRMKERRKPGLKKARKASQFSKR